MRERTGLHIALGLIGMAAWMIFILACTGWPAWSPDGSKILFTAAGADDKQFAVMMYDLKSGKLQQIFVQQSAGEAKPIPAAQWTKDGRQAIVTVVETRENNWPVQIVVMPIGSTGPLRYFTLPPAGEDVLLPPFVELAGKLYVSGKYLGQLDLHSGAVVTQEVANGQGPILLTDGARIYYEARGRSKEGVEDGLDFGELDPGTLALNPLFHITEAELETHGATNKRGFPALQPGGPVFTLTGNDHAQPSILVIARGHVERVIHPELPAPAFELANLQWAADGKTIYSIVFVPAERQGWVQASFAEIPADGGPTRLTPIAQVQQGSENELGLIYVQAALSPDGSTVAATTALLPQGFVDDADRGLYLFDVYSRKVTKVPVALAGAVKE